jgi:hypothetical protein
LVNKELRSSTRYSSVCAAQVLCCVGALWKNPA